MSRYLVEISAISAFFGLNLVAMTTPFAPRKIEIAYLNSPTPITLLFTRKILNILPATEISAILAYFCPNLVAMATPFAPRKIEIAYLNSSTHITLLFTRKILNILSQ